MEECSHLADDLTPPVLTGLGCADCLAAGSHDWVHLRFCQTCGHVGCCDNSPKTHATKHYQESGHGVLRSLEPEEDWWYCYIDDVAFEIEGGPPAPSYA